MPDIKRGDFLKSIMQTTKLSRGRAKEVAKAAGLDLGFSGRTLSRSQEQQIAKALPGAIKKLGYRVVGARDESRFRQKLAKSNRQFKESQTTPPPREITAKQALKNKADFLEKIRHGLPESEEQKFADNLPNLETATNQAPVKEPTAPDIG